MYQWGADSYRIAYDNDYLGYNISNNQAEHQGLIYVRDNIASRNDLRKSPYYGLLFEWSAKGYEATADSREESS